MHGSPSIQQIASELAQVSARRKTNQVTNDSQGPSRILCLELRALPVAGLKRSVGPRSSTRSMQAVTEAFLKFSPRVQMRQKLAPRTSAEARALAARQGPSTGEAFWVFIDIGSTSHLFKGEEGLMRSAMSLSRDLGFGVQCAIADTPAGAQAFATAHHEMIIPPGEERERLKDLSLPLLLHLEGLEPWEKLSRVEEIVTFFFMLGFKTASDLSRFTQQSFKERWGETGELVWRRLNALDRQVVSPLLPTEPLVDYAYMDFPVAIVSLLLHQMQKSVDFLFARLQGRRLFARKLEITLFCEYSKTSHKIEIEPNNPSRDRELFLTLIENRLGGISLENPIRDFELAIVPCPEKARQLDFFEPRTTDHDKLETLFSLLSQSALKPGRYHIEPAILPEKGWRLVADKMQDYETSPDPTPKKKRGARASRPSPRNAARARNVSGAAGAAQLGDGRQRELATVGGLALAEPDGNRDALFMSSTLPSARFEEEPAIAPQPHYGAMVMQAPRPTRLLQKPLLLTVADLQRLKILSANPIERLEDAWWETDTRRDYYFAIGSDGQCLWVYQDLRTGEHYLHGYFD